MTESDEETLATIASFIDDFYEPHDADKTLVAPLAGEACPWPIDCHDGVERTVSKPSKRSAAKIKSHNRSRERQREELLRLREEEKALRTKLLELAMMRSTRSSQKSEEPDGYTVMAMWKNLATRQYKRRSIAESENMRLRERVLDQRRVIESLQAMMARQLAQAANPRDSLYAPAWKAICADEDPYYRKLVFSELVPKLRGAYESTHLWLDECRVCRGQAHPYVDSRVVAVSSTQIAVEVINIRSFPFNYHVAGDAYWSRGVNYVCSVMDYFKEQATIDEKELVFMGKAFSDEGDLASSKGIRLRTHTASQKFVDKDHVVIASASRTESVHVRYESLPDVRLQEQYWKIFCPSESDPDQACDMLCVGRVVLDLESRLADIPYAVGDLTKYFSTRMHHHLSMAVEKVEDWMLVEAKA
ncbi:hypothetical protein Poli38472_007559 [Pythium oligandrum]|uniref:Uncharacterized protein n=1 Tax=Pythium oligandrum TaxID=41045 RepID=A0A8K1CSE5_PYTOL|nr:hypothetical protein Poli38472_007559 [Pythium oligandrum]|eukprot:TMW67887.1 hypothetical protein Poli38472_007559 [Pythium oligandrum]